MADFNGVISNKICENLIEFIVEWRVIRDLDYNTYKYKGELYMDASACSYLSTQKASVVTNSLFIIADPNASTDVNLSALATTRFTMPNFSALTNIKNRIHLASVETSSMQVGEEPVSVIYQVDINFNGTVRAYKNLISYVESRQVEHAGGTLHLNGIVPHSITGISGDFLLNHSHTIAVNKTETDFTHSVEYICGKEKIVLAEKSSAESFSFTPPVSLAAQNTEGTTVDTTFYIRTYYGDRLKGTKTVDYTFTIPDSVKPSCTLEVTDGEFKDGDYLSDYYGGFVQNHSRFHIKVTPTLAYDSPIEEYEVEVDGVPYTLTDAEMDTAIVVTSGAHSIKARVKDARDRTSETHSTTVKVIPYTSPVVTDLTATRCNLDGTENPKGGCMKVVFSAAVTPLSNKNSAVYVITHSKTSGLDYFEGVLGDYTGQYAVEGGEYIFEADIDSTYVIQVKAKDDFEDHTRTVGGGLTVILMNWLASGRGMCFGGVATLEDTVECQFKFYPSGGVLIPPFTANNLYIKDPGTYYIENPADIINCPVDDPFILEIYPISADGLDIMQRLTTCPTGEAPRVIVRALQNSSWGSFYDMTTGQSI